MYVWMWRRLPGPWPLKALESMALLAVTVLLLFAVVFPWVEPRLPFNKVTVNEGTTTPQDAPAVDPGLQAPASGTGQELGG